MRDLWPYRQKRTNRRARKLPRPQLPPNKVMVLRTHSAAERGHVVRNRLFVVSAWRRGREAARRRGRRRGEDFQGRSACFASRAAAVSGIHGGGSVLCCDCVFRGEGCGCPVGPAAQAAAAVRQHSQPWPSPAEAADTIRDPRWQRQDFTWPGTFQGAGRRAHLGSHPSPCCRH
jgi:hypothetical protein